MAGPGLLGELRKGCKAFREQLLAGRLATAEELAPYWPGGADNKYRGQGGKTATLRNWVRCYTVYGGFARRVEWKHAKREAAPGAHRETLLDAIGEVPETVELLSIDPATKQRRRLTVYQKGDLALKEVHKANGDLAICIDEYKRASELDTIDGWEAAKRWLDELTYLQRLIVWIVTSPGPRLPYPEGVLAPDLPNEYADLSPVDFYGIAQAYQRVNILPLTVLETSLAPKTRADWATFWTAMEFELHTPIPTLRRDRGLAGLVAASAEHARMHDEAEAKAKAEAEAERGAPPRAGAA